jgi:hypothetical protein
MSSKRKYPDGRDEMNLADFPISVLQRQQKSDAAGNKQDRLEFEASRYDATTRQRVRQRVTLTSTAREGLPTPADEHVVLALLYVAKHGNNFADATVHFAPGQLFDIMGWAPNGRSYTRLRDVLRRLKALTIRYENAWWDVVGRGYEEEVATGIISGYRIARQVSGPRKEGTPLSSWVTWAQQFHESLQNGNIKRLDLDVFFSLSTPTAQRMYRLLDKRFYSSPMVTMDLVEFACGHVGLTDAGNVALLKRRLAPAIGELERIGFIAPADVSQRYQKVKAGVWRVVFRSASASAAGPGVVEEVAIAEPKRAQVTGTGEAVEVAREFYRLWAPAAPAQPGARDIEQAEALLGAHGPEATKELIAVLVQVTRHEWPDCRSLSGAVQKYLADALKLYEQKQQREASKRAAELAKQQDREAERGQQSKGQELKEAWSALSVEEREGIEKVVRARLGASAPEAFVQRLCLEEMGRRMSVA